MRNLIRAARRDTERPDGSGSLSLSEMLPGPDELWMTDSAGSTYTSEFRLVAVDDHITRRLVPLDWWAHPRENPGGHE
ncbi:hypothetical protein Val02_37450 [Virgisporangium aliadipatigenens]|uniref:Uncharacterized protein n=1 Tax=Virgisporangium aliadipatigenens TaxID=741659 RepID=A0A8J3YK20_9ACTN|nr:hypothetical protein Val02_37450 [Virgisporangium aliadipatigenens]